MYLTISSLSYTRLYIFQLDTSRMSMGLAHSAGVVFRAFRLACGQYRRDRMNAPSASASQPFTESVDFDCIQYSLLGCNSNRVRSIKEKPTPKTGAAREGNPMEKSRNLRSFTLASVSLLAMSAGAFAQTTGAPGETTETVVVTGSRVITDIANSPTPVTTVTTAQLLDTTPSNLSDALNKLPV